METPWDCVRWIESLPNAPANDDGLPVGGSLAARLLAERLTELVGLNHEAESRIILELAARASPNQAEANQAEANQAEANQAEANQGRG